MEDFEFLPRKWPNEQRPIEALQHRRSHCRFKGHILAPIDCLVNCLCINFFGKVTVCYLLPALLQQVLPHTQPPLRVCILYSTFAGYVGKHARSGIS
jgi:hypothetical protein